MSSEFFFAHSTAVIDDGCKIGEGTKIWHFSHVMPESIIGEKCNIGQNVVISPKVKLGNNVKVQAQSGIGRHVKDNEVLQGSPSFTYGDWNKSYVYFKNLPKIVKTITDLEKKVNCNN